MNSDGMGIQGGMLHAGAAPGDTRMKLDAGRFQHVMALFTGACERPVEQRAAFLAESCGADAAMRTEVEQLLEASGQSAGFLETPALEVMEAAPPQPAAEDGLVWSCPACASIYPEGHVFCALDRQNLRLGPDPLLGATLDRYRIEEALGDGASGRVYRASHVTLDCEYAIKVLYGDRATNDAFVARFRREAQAVSQMRHPNVISVVDFVTTPEGQMFLVMELVKGATLSEAIDTNGALPPNRAAAICRQIASGLAEAHGRGFVHRDLKPDNVMLEPWQAGENVKILDFGVVGLAPGSGLQASLTGTGRTVGTPLYMAPEQLRDSKVGPQADLYALGVILYEMLMGRKPFDGSLMEVVAQKESTIPPLPPSGGLERLALHMLSVAPAQRPASALDVIAEIDRLELSTESTPPAQNLVGLVPTAVEDVALATSSDGPTYDNMNDTDAELPTHS